MFKEAALFLGLAGSTAAQSVIAGYQARTDATAHLNLDLIQKELEDLIEDESCDSFALLENFYEGNSGSGLGSYFTSIPTYGTGSGENLAQVTMEFTKFYGGEDFHDKIVTRAIANKKTKFSNGNIDFPGAFGTNTDFGTPQGCIGYEEIVKKSLSYTSTLYEGFQQAQKAIDAAVNGCRAQRDGCTEAIAAWDSSVAIYVGSLEGTDGNNVVGGDYGKAPYALGDKRCRNFKNCGPTHDLFTRNETAPANTQILAYYAAGSHAAYIGDFGLMEFYLRLISNKAAIPLIQGTLRYAYRLSEEEFGPGTGSDSDKEIGEMVAFAVGALPKVWACSKKAYNKIFDQTKLDSDVFGTVGDPLNYQNVRLGFECNYKCLGITCKEVGSLFDDDDSPTPKPGAEACDDEDNGSENVCDKPKRSRKSACKQYTKQPGIKNRDKLKFDGPESF